MFVVLRWLTVCCGIIHVVNPGIYIHKIFRTFVFETELQKSPYLSKTQEVGLPSSKQ